MKDLIIKNINDISVSPIERDGNSFTVKPIVAGAHTKAMTDIPETE